MSCGCEPTEILITALGQVNDDLRVRVNNTTVFDPRRRATWYNGEFTHRGVDVKPIEATYGFPIARVNVARDVHAPRHCRVVPGSRVFVDVFNGWGDIWKTSQWQASLRWPNGKTWQTAGGSNASSASIYPAAVLGTVAAGISGASVSFGSFPAGRYRVRYLSGAMKFAQTAGFFWQVRRTNPELGFAGPRVVWNGGSDYATTDMGNYATIAEAEAANANAFVNFTHGGGAISMFLQDSNYPDNSDGPIYFQLLEGDYFTTGPHFESYLPNGSFVVPCPPA